MVVHFRSVERRKSVWGADMVSSICGAVLKTQPHVPQAMKEWPSFATPQLHDQYYDCLSVDLKPQPSNSFLTAKRRPSSWHCIRSLYLNVSPRLRFGQ